VGLSIRLRVCGIGCRSHVDTGGVGRVRATSSKKLVRPQGFGSAHGKVLMTVCIESMWRYAISDLGTEVNPRGSLFVKAENLHSG
jgi:hypothetical protein